MQVAAPAAAFARASYASFSASYISLQATISITQTNDMSPMARWAINYLANSSQLTDGEKRILVDTIATIDHFAGGDPKLIRDVIAVAKLMEASRPVGAYRTHTFKELEDMYWEEREKLGDKHETTETISLQITALSMQYTQADISLSADTGGAPSATSNISDTPTTSLLA